jgi:hypothetical protein
MTTIEKSIEIHGERDAIWRVIESPETYTKWCEPFCVGTFYEGAWRVGNTVRFIGLDENGVRGGLVSEVVAYEAGHHVTFRHKGFVQGDQEVFDTPEVAAWAGCEEGYVLEGGPDVYTLHVSCQVAEEMAEWMDATWTEAVGRIKAIAEGTESAT